MSLKLRKADSKALDNEEEINMSLTWDQFTSLN